MASIQVTIARRSSSLLLQRCRSSTFFWSSEKIFGDPVAVAAMVDCLVHHAEVSVLRGDSYRLKGKGKAVA